MSDNSKSAVKEGTIKFYNETKGYGFIIDQHGQEVFFHRSRVKSEISRKNQDQKVTYNLFAGKKGDEAENVTLK